MTYMGKGMPSLSTEVVGFGGLCNNNANNVASWAVQDGATIDNCSKACLAEPWCIAMNIYPGTCNLFSGSAEKPPSCPAGFGPNAGNAATDMYGNEYVVVNLPQWTREDLKNADVYFKQVPAQAEGHWEHAAGGAGDVDLSALAGDMGAGGGRFMITWSTAASPSDLSDHTAYEFAAEFTVPGPITASARSSTGAACSDSTYFVEVDVSCKRGECKLPAKMSRARGVSASCR